MHTWNTLNVDSHLDWTLARNTRVAKRTVKIPKTTYDTIKYMRGWDFDESFKTYNFWGGKHCATYARDFWNRYVDSSFTNNTKIPTGIFEIVSPAQIANAIDMLRLSGNRGD